MRKIFPIIVGLLLIFGFYYLASTSGPGDKVYRELDQLIKSDYTQLKISRAQLKITQQDYITGLKQLSIKEDDLFNEVRLHKFEDIKEHNYWHRSRLKFPSSIKMELDLITKAEKDST